MSYRIEITADTLTELAGRAMAFAIGIQTTAAYDASVASAEAPKPKAKKGKADDGVALNSAPHPVGETRVADDADINPAALKTVEVEVADEALADPTPPASASDAPELDFDRDVAPNLIEAVERVGRERVTETLSQFGVARASELDPSQYGELVDALKDLA